MQNPTKIDNWKSSYFKFNDNFGGGPKLDPSFSGGYQKVTFDKRVEFKKPIEPDINNFMVSPATTVSDDYQHILNPPPFSAF